MTVGMSFVVLFILLLHLLSIVVDIFKGSACAGSEVGFILGFKKTVVHSDAKRIAEGEHVD